MSAELAIARRAAGQLARGALGWGLAFAATVASSAATYVSSFPDATSRAQLAATVRGDAGVSMLLGPITAIDTVGGYTVYKCFVFLTTIGAIWAVLAATRLLRGEEDAGRWQLLLAGGTRATGATAATVVVLAAGALVVGAAAGAGAALAGLDPEVGFAGRDVVVYGASLAMPVAVFAAVGALTSQLARTRRLASGLGLGAVGAAFVVRMIADSGPATQWLLWATPFGWTERVRPFGTDDLRPVVLALGAATIVACGAIVLAGRRDAGAGVLGTGDSGPARRWGLGSVWALAFRLERGALAGWMAGIVAGSAAFGIIARLATSTPPDSMADLLDRLGVHGAFARQFFGVVFLLLAAVVALVPATVLGGGGEEESSGRIVHVLAQPVRRRAVLAARVAVATTAVLGCALAAGLVAWAAAASQGVHPGFGAVVGASLNIVPTALVATGIGAVALAVAPRFAATAVYAVVSWSLLVDMVASLVSGLAPLGRLTLFHYLALAPAAAVDATATAVTLALAIALCGIAFVLFERRDVECG